MSETLHTTIHQQLVPYAQTGSFSKLILDYLDGQLSSFVKYTPELASFEQAIQDKSKASIDRETLATVLLEQAQQTEAPEAVIQNIERLKASHTFTVTTAHQPNLFTGPMYFIYKIISTINLAERLSKAYPDQQFVPVFYMGAEDHDLEELNHFYLFGDRFTWETQATGAVGEMDTKSLSALIEQVKERLGDAPLAQEVANMLEASYLGQPTIALATHHFVNQLFGEYGLVVLRASDARLKTLFAPVIKAELTQQASHGLVNATIAELEAYKIQVSPREINLFYLDEGIRERIVQENGRYQVLHTDLSFTEAELLAMVDAHPERFSPNVILRGLYQETILPNLAYIGGGGELAYWLEYKRLFEHYQVNFPMLLLRNSVLWIDQPTWSKMDKLGLTVDMLFTATEQLIKDYVEANTSRELDLQAERDQVKALYDGILEKAMAIDKGLEKPILAEQQKQLNALENLEKKLIRAEKQRHDTAINQIRKLKEKLFPGHKLQERHDTYMQYHLRYGKGFIEVLKDQLDPLDKRFCVMLEGQVAKLT